MMMEDRDPELFDDYVNNNIYFRKLFLERGRSNR